MEPTRHISIIPVRIPLTDPLVHGTGMMFHYFFLFP